MGISLCILVGNVTRDPEIKKLPSGVPFAWFSLAVNKMWKDKSGEKKSSVNFHNIEVYGGLAELCAKYLHKGSQAYVEGEVENRNWDDKKTGEKKNKTVIRAANIQFLNRQKESGQDTEPSELDEIPF